MKNILVTGGCGFIGSNFIHHLINNNDSFYIVNLDKLTYAGNISNLSQISNSSHTLIEGDICDPNIVKSLFDKYEFESIIHFAAESHVDRSIDGPSSFIQTNIIGTLNLLEHARLYFSKTKNKNFRFLHVSTDEVYGSLDDEGKFVESTPYDPSSPYSASKAGSDHLVRAWNRTYDLPTLITNCSNNYGPFHFPEKLIPHIILNAIHGKKIPIYGDGKQIRDWIYVDDHVRGLIEVFHSGKKGDTYNIGGSNEIQNIDTAIKICSILDDLISKKPQGVHFFRDLICYVDDRPGHDRRYAIDSSKIQSTLNWRPKESFDTGLKKTVKWYLDNPQWWEAIFKKNYALKRLGKN